MVGLKAMKRLLGIFTGMTVAALFPVQASEPVVSSHLAGYTLAWSDEFDGDALDRTCWNVEVNGTGCGNNELQYYVDDPRNVHIENGNLVITARRQKYKDHDFTSGRLNTNRKYAFTYGVVEARIKLPKTADGLWPAFWMMGNDINEQGWPYCGETDILEMGHANGIAAQAQERLFNGAFHWGVNSGSHRQKVGDRLNEYSLQDGEYHHYFLVWTPERIDMFVDDIPEPYASMDISKRATPEENGFYFHKPNFLLLNLAVGGNFPGIHDASKITALPTGEASMWIDYVRVYQKTDEGLAAVAENAVETKR
jgi:1,3-(1,3;1,4)-beta-D-glucan 3(4)-glucanohydrolase